MCLYVYVLVSCSRECVRVDYPQLPCYQHLPSFMAEIFSGCPLFYLGLVEILCEIFLSTDWLGYRYHLNKLPLDEAYDWIIWIRLGIELIKF